MFLTALYLVLAALTGLSLSMAFMIVTAVLDVVFIWSMVDMRKISEDSSEDLTEWEDE